MRLNAGALRGMMGRDGQDHLARGKKWLKSFYRDQLISTGEGAQEARQPWLLRCRWKAKTGRIDLAGALSTLRIEDQAQHLVSLVRVDNNFSNRSESHWDDLGICYSTTP